jgi:sugar phosphate isomerase/epimerase
MAPAAIIWNEAARHRPLFPRDRDLRRWDRIAFSKKMGGRLQAAALQEVTMFQTALHSVSYAGVWLNQARLSLDDFLTRAWSLGFESVMLMAKRPHLSVLDFDNASTERLRWRVDELGLKVACIAGYTDFTIGSDRPEIPTREMQVLYVTQLSRLASTLGCRLVRVFTGYTRANVAYDQAWNSCVEGLKGAARRAADFGVTLAVQNHHDIAAHFEGLSDLLDDVDEPNCQAAFDAWSPALQGSDLVAAVRRLGPRIVHTTVADYARRPRFRYLPELINYTPEPSAICAVPMGEGFIDYRSFFGALREIGYQGAVGYEMCSPLRGGGSEQNLDRYAKQFLDWMRAS